ncbi:MAG TPA: DUF222 domain-containing protein [Acidimicrobiales bacterium]|nr:DUF222 domain-containing protein [Acidimicrobiales bacterium]
MAAGLVAAIAALRAALVGFDPLVLSGADCARLVEELAGAEKACAAARALAAGRAAECGSHRAAGYSDAAGWLASRSGTSGAEARRALDTARGLRSCPDTRTAALDGQVSLAQAGEITQAAAQAPGVERELLAVAARRGDLAAVQEEARRRRLAAADVDALHRRQRAARSARWWRDGEGMIRLAAAFAPEVGVAIANRLEAATARHRRQERRTDVDAVPTWPQAAADTLAGLLLDAPVGAGEAPRAGRRTELVIVCDLHAWRRGHAHAGEVCQVIGGGPLPVEVARDLAENAFVKAVLHDGVEIRTVAHYGRRLPAELRSALDLGSPPDFAGAACVDCGQRWGLEYDHIDPVAHGGPTSYANLAPRCWRDHQAKTEQDRRAGLLAARPGHPPERTPAPAAGRSADGGPSP